VRQGEVLELGVVELLAHAVEARPPQFALLPGALGAAAAAHTLVARGTLLRLQLQLAELLLAARRVAQPLPLGGRLLCRRPRTAAASRAHAGGAPLVALALIARAVGEHQVDELGVGLGVRPLELAEHRDERLDAEVVREANKEERDVLGVQARRAVEAQHRVDGGLAWRRRGQQAQLAGEGRLLELEPLDERVERAIGRVRLQPLEHQPVDLVVRSDRSHAVGRAHVLEDREGEAAPPWLEAQEAEEVVGLRPRRPVPRLVRLLRRTQEGRGAPLELALLVAAERRGVAMEAR
jgi:hypothetical protein